MKKKLKIWQMKDEYKTIARTVANILPSQCIVIFSGYIPGLISSFLAGFFLDSETLAVISYAEPLKTIITGMTCVISVGYSILLGRYTGSGDSKKINSIYTIGIVYCLIFGIFCTLIYDLAAFPIGNLLGVPNEALGCFAEYIYGWSIAATLILLLVVHMITLSVFSQQKCVYFYIPLFIVVNILLGFLFLKLFDMGSFGLGLATSLTSLISFIFMFVWLRWRCINIKISLSSFSFSELNKMIVVGSPMTFGYVCLAIKDVVRNTFATQLGGITAVAAISVSVSASSIFDMIPLGIAGAITIISSMYIGIKNKDKLFDLIRFFIKYLSLLNICITIIWFISCYWICSIFTSDPEVLSIALRFAIFLGVYILLCPVCECIIQLYQCLGRVLLCNILYLFNYLIIRVSIMYFLSPCLSLDAVWLSYPLSEVLGFIFIFMLCAIKKRGLPNSIADFLCLGDEFSHVKNYMCCATNADEVIMCSRKVYNYLDSIGVEGKQKLFTSLACEEIGIDVFTNNCSENRIDNCYCEFAVIYDNEKIFLQITDNADMFSPKDYEMVMKSEDLAFHFGMRYIINLSKSTNYLNVASLNVYSVMF